MEADGSGKQQAVFHPDNDAQSDWAPDGTKIVYRSRRNSQFEISIVDFTVRDAAGRPAITDIPKRAGRDAVEPARVVPGHERPALPPHATAPGPRARTSGR